MSLLKRISQNLQGEDFPSFPTPNNKFSYSIGDCVDGPFGKARILAVESIGNQGNQRIHLQQLEDWGNDSEIVRGYRFWVDSSQINHL